MATELQEIEKVKKALKDSDKALSISEILELTDDEIQRRTLFRRLNRLTELGIIEKTGRGRGTTYQMILEEPEPAQYSEGSPVPLTVKSKDILALLNRPQTVRPPVGYQKDFLNSYQPNITSYLSKEEKKRLADLGKTARQDEPAGTYARDILERLLIDLSWNSSRLEGNTYSILETERLLSLGEVAENKSSRDAQMILNHKDAIEFIVSNTEEIDFNSYTIYNLHALLSYNLLPDPDASGRLRTMAVGIHDSVFIPLNIPQVIMEMFNLMLERVNQIEDPFEQAFFIMVQLPYLQPFDDVNKRVSRLAANIPLNKRNLIPISFIDVPDSLYIKGLLAVYELNRVELLKDVFLWAYERSSAKYSAVRQILGEPDPFKMKYRKAIHSLIYEIVSERLHYKEAAPLIEKAASTISLNDQKKFKETIEIELMALQERNIARYKIRPSEFHKWKETWSK